MVTLKSIRLKLLAAADAQELEVELPRPVADRNLFAVFDAGVVPRRR